MSEAIDCAFSVAGEGPAVFMIHGIGARKTGWNKIVDALQDSFTCITYDLRGHGDSPMPATRFGLDELVEDLEALRQRLSIDSASFIGHSLGGMIAPAYVRKYPKHVRLVGLLSTAAFRSAEDRAKLAAVGNAMREKGIAQVLDTLCTRWFTDEFAHSHPEVIEWRKAQVLATDPGIFLNVFDIYAETEMSPWLHEVSQPSLILTGEFDLGCNPDLNRKIHKALPNSELVILDGLRHAILIEASERVVPPVKNFLSRQG